MPEIARIAVVMALAGGCTTGERARTERALPLASGHHAYGAAGLEQPRMTLHLDRETPHATVVTLLSSARESGFASYGIAVLDGGQLRELGVLPPTDGPFHQVQPINVRVDAARIVIEDAREVTDVAALQAEAAAIHAERPHEPVVRLRAADDVPLQRIVETIDALDGPGCDLDGALQSEAVPEACWFWVVVLERDGSP